MKVRIRPVPFCCLLICGLCFFSDAWGEGRALRRGISVKPDAADLVYGKEERNRLDVFLPEGSEKGADLPVLVFVHGGAWRIGDKSQFGYLGRAFAEEGFVAVTINYRLHPEVVFPAFVEDAALSVKWVRENIRDYGGDPEKVFLMGHSAGAHIVSLLGADERYLDAALGKGDRAWLRGVIPVAGPHRFDPSRTRSLKPVFGEFASTERPSPAAFTDGGEPPYLLIFGGRDRLVAVREGRDMEAAINKAGGKVEVSFHPALGHIEVISHFSPAIAPDSPLRDTAVKFMRKWGG